MSIKSMGSVLQVKIYREILSDIYYEQALELFLTEYPNGKKLRGKRLPAGYVTSQVRTSSCKKEKRLNLNNGRQQ